MPPIATSAQAAFQGRDMTFTVAPWPLDGSVAFLCLRKPGGEFSAQNPRPAPDAGCVPLDVESSGDRLTATFAAATLSPALAGEFGRSAPPWFLALAGERAPFAASTVLTVIDSPIPSDPGPS